MTSCFHCGLPAISTFSADIDGQNRSFCCLGCQAVTHAIIAGGLSDFYAYRDTLNNKVEQQSNSFLAYDLDEVQQEFVTRLDGDIYEAIVTVDGISCAACAWLIESRLKQFDDIQDITVNVSNYRCRIAWDKSSLKLSKIFQVLTEIGYQASPRLETEENIQRKNEQRVTLMRLGVAGIGMMQVGMYAIALHAGDIQGMEARWQVFFRWVSLLVATPVVFYSARPFFSNAWRALSLAKLNMDVPVSVAIGLAYIASLWATLKNTGDVYFDSISMFTFFLLLGRFLEMRVRHSSAFSVEKVSRLLPLTAQRQRGKTYECVPIKAIGVGDQISVAAGEVIPCDGQVCVGEGGVDEAMLTGESEHQLKKVGDPVFAGTVNAETALRIRVTAVGKNTRLATVEKLVDRALLAKPAIISSVDRLASVFILCVLIAACAVGSFWYFVAPERALWIVLAVLVATCPCALSLATPAALTAGTLRMRDIGLLVSSNQFIEKLAAVDQVVFDKTGTLTEGNTTLSKIKCLSVLDESRVVQIIASLEASSSHPIARAFIGIDVPEPAAELKTFPAQGIQGRIENTQYRFGRREFVWPQAILPYPGEGMWQLLANEFEPLAWVLLEDSPRKNIVKLLHELSSRKITVDLLSGDRQENVENFAKAFGFNKWIAGAQPDNKLEYIHSLQTLGKQVLMVGDGINDVPVLSGASISIAMGQATRLAQTHADAILINGNLLAISRAFELAGVIRKKIRQNLGWALSYNASILPLAAAGFVPPYLAAIGMSLSSLVVVLNATRMRSV